MNSPKSLLLDYLSTLLPYGVEPDTIIDEPKSYPIKFSLNYSLHSGKYIYLGETAHTLHPVGGQGLNLCWRDVTCLTNLVSYPLFRNNKYFIPLFYSLFRIFDILKPYPISFVDKELKNGFGFVFDDVLAGIFANILFIIIANYFLNTS